MRPTLTREMTTTGRPSHLALNDGRFKVVQLLEYEATMGARPELASESGLIQVLLDHGADVDIEGGFDETPFQVATKMRHHDVRLLLDNDAEK
jgi:hypothetical protein